MVQEVCEMFCKNCGKEVKEGSQYCTACGHAVGGSSVSAPQSEAAATDSSQSKTTAPAPPQSAATASSQQNGAEQSGALPVKHLGMNWFKYMIYFGLFAGAALNVFLGIYSVGGFAYGELADAVYDAFPGLKAADIMYGIYLFCAAAVCIDVRFKLAAYKAKGINEFIVLYAMNLGAFGLYIIVCMSILSDTGIQLTDLLGSQQIAWLVSTVAMLVINVIYLKRRRHMFV